MIQGTEKSSRFNKFVSTWARATVVLYPTLTMWVPIGVEAWMLITLFIIAGWLLGQGAKGWRNCSLKAEQKTIFLALLAMVGIKVLSLVWSVDAPATRDNLGLFWHLLLYLPLVVLFRWVDNVEVRLTQAFRLAAWVGGAWAIIALAAQGGGLAGIEFEGAAKNSLVLALPLTFMCSYLALRYWQLHNHLDALALLACAPILVANGKRSALLILLLFISLAAWKWRREQFRQGMQGGAFGARAFALSGTLALGLAMLFWATWHKWLLAWYQILSFFTLGYQGGSLDTRLQLYALAWQNFLAHPWLGTGAATTRYVVEHAGPSFDGLDNFNHFHQLLLQQLSDLGVVGAAVWVVALITIHRRLVKSSGGHPLFMKVYAWTLVSVMVAFGFANLSFGNILIHMFWVYLLALFSMTGLPSSGPQPPAPSTPSPQYRR